MNDTMTKLVELKRKSKETRLRCLKVTKKDLEWLRKSIFQLMTKTHDALFTSEKSAISTQKKRAENILKVALILIIMIFEWGLMGFVLEILIVGLFTFY